MMMNRHRHKTNNHLVELISLLKRESFEHKAQIWKDIAKRLESPSSQWAEVNLSRLDRFCDKGEVIIVPGKVLGSGELDKALTVAAYASSASARDKIKKAGGKLLSIQELLKQNPKGSKIRIMG
jgi:large subunit ribosomal protein L18e